MFTLKRVNLVMVFLGFIKFQSQELKQKQQFKKNTKLVGN